MLFCMKKRKTLIIFLITILICSELVQFCESDSSLIKVLKLAKRVKKLKKFLPLLLMGPKVLVIKTGSTGYQSDPCYSSSKCCYSDYLDSYQYPSYNSMESSYPSYSGSYDHSYSGGSYGTYTTPSYAPPNHGPYKSRRK